MCSQILISELTGIPHELHAQGYWWFPWCAHGLGTIHSSVLHSPLLTLNIKWWHVVITKNIFGKTPLLYYCSVICCQETIPHFLLTQKNTNKLPSLQEHTKNKCNAPTETLLSSPDFESSFLFTWEEGEQDCHKLSQSKVPQCLTTVPKKTFSTVVPNAQCRISGLQWLQSKIIRYIDKQTRAQHFFSNTHILLCKIHLGEVL